jgi:uncharacterized YigZ family protein
MARSYFVPAEEIRREHTILNSRFIGTLAPVENDTVAREFIKRIRTEYQDASHNVPAYIIGGGNSVTEYCSDDGEPQGTSGRPALAVLRGSGLGNVALVITRYFGGTKLGKGGLVKAYTESAQMVVNAVQRARKIEVYIALLVTPYPLLERIRLITPQHEGTILSEDFAADVTMTLQFPVDKTEAFQRAIQELSGGKLKVKIIETTETLIPVT